MKHPLSIIARTVCEIFEVDLARLRGPLRLRPFVRARQAFMLLARREGHSFPRIARYLDDRDHTTVIHGCRRAEELFAEDYHFGARLNRTSHRLEAMREEV